MPDPDIASRYRGYLDCLNRRDWDALGGFVAATASHNGRPLGLSGYRRMLEEDCEAIPDLRFAVALMVVEPPTVACRLAFDCTPRGAFLGVPVNGRRVRFTEHVFYRFGDGLIQEVWSLIDKAAVEAQLEAQPSGG